MLADGRRGGLSRPARLPAAASCSAGRRNQRAAHLRRCAARLRLGRRLVGRRAGGDFWLDRAATKGADGQLRHARPAAKLPARALAPLPGRVRPEIHPDLAPRASFNDWGDRYDGGAGSGYGRLSLSARRHADRRVVVLAGGGAAERHGARGPHSRARDARHARAPKGGQGGWTRPRRDGRRAARQHAHGAQGSEPGGRRCSAPRRRFGRGGLEAAPRAAGLCRPIPSGADQFTGEVDAIIAAATKLIDHHREILRDATDPEPRTQLDIPRPMRRRWRWTSTPHSGRSPNASSRAYRAARVGECGASRPPPPPPRSRSRSTSMRGCSRRLGRSRVGRDLDEVAAAELRTELRAIVAAPLRAGAAAFGGGGGETTIRLAAGGEVAAAGALASPQLLMLSGLGMRRRCARRGALPPVAARRRRGPPGPRRGDGRLRVLDRRRHE